MKKIINSVVAALILSVMLTLFNPQWFFKGDARWTYRNDAARLDVIFSGHLKRGRIGAVGANLRVSQPTWLSNSDYQGTCVAIPVSYRKHAYRIKLTPRADEWGTDAALVIKFVGWDFQHEGQRKPAWVCFRNITLNGQNVAAEKVVWHNRPFMLKYPPHSSPEITLGFDVCKPIAVDDIAFVKVTALFIVCLLLSLFFAFPQTMGSTIPKFVCREDIVKVLSEGLSKSYRHIDPVYRRSFWIIFGVLCFAFGFHTICFMWGNHDWFLLNSNHRWLEGAHMGRYMLFSVKTLLSKGVYLPLIHDIITFVTLALNAVLLCKYWRLEKRVIYYVLCGLVLTVQPFTLNMMYFVHMTPEVFIGVACILTALLLSEKVALTGVPLIRKLVYSLLAIVLVNFVPAMYPVLINTIAVVFVGRLLVYAFDWDGSRRQLKSYMKPCLISMVHIILGIVLYRLVITFVFPMKSGYNTDTLPLDQIPERLGVLMKQNFQQLCEYNMPFLSQWTLWVFLGFTILLTLHICFTGNFKQKIVRLVLLFGSLFATNTALIIAKTYVIDGRLGLFGLVFFEVLVMAVALTRLEKLRNLSAVAGVCVIATSVLHDLDCLRVWKLGFDAEKMHWNRVLARLETQKEFDPNKKYDVIQVGLSISMRPRYYTGKYTHNTSPLLWSGWDPNFSVYSAPAFFYPTNFRRRGLSSYLDVQRRDYVAQLKRLYQAGVLQKADVWPQPNGLIVWKDIILFVTDKRELEQYKRQFEREQRGKRGRTEGRAGKGGEERP